MRPVQVLLRPAAAAIALLLLLLTLLLLLQKPQSHEQLEPIDRVMNQIPFEPFLTSQERWIQLQMLHAIDQLFKHYNVTYFIYAGTLLGSHRHMGLIPWDDDIDVLVNITCKQQLPDMLRHMAPSLSLRTTDNKSQDKVYHGLSRRTCRQSWCDWRWPYLDILYFEENQTHIWDTVITYGRRNVYPKFLTLPTHPRPLEHLWLPAPRDTLAFLQLTYGMTRTCLTPPYSHMLEDGGKSYRKPCQELRDRVAFVHRRPCSAAADSSKGSGDACLLETLRLGSRVLRMATVAEPSYAINQPYALRLAEGFTQPKDYPDMNITEIM